MALLSEIYSPTTPPGFLELILEIKNWAYFNQKREEAAMGKVEAIDLYKGKIRFKNLGREKVNKTVEINSVAEFIKAVSPHCASNKLNWIYDYETNSGKIVVGGFRLVGDFEKVFEGAEGKD